ncbi:MAG: hypothetical protein QOH41_773 [Blastocatellia bacterium]|jgi:hypothetical protein|nr:hypothetical protein [Blastocatellia bacterium]
MTKTTLLFDSLPTFERTPLFFSLNDDVDQPLRTLPNTYARCNAALRFNSCVGAKADMLGVRDEELPSMHAAYLRAALMEFAGMEETLRSELDAVSQPLRIKDTKNAMLVVLRKLRNVQVHLVRNELLAAKRPAVLRWKEQEHQHELTALMIPRADLDKLKDSRNSSHYDSADFNRAIDWLAQAQEHWGIHDVVREGIWAYAKAIVDAHVPATKQLSASS